MPYGKRPCTAIHVDDARLLVGSEYSTRELPLEGQLLGTPGENPRLGGSLGLFVEKQNPWCSISGGARVAGTADPVKDNRASISDPGVCLWQHVRIGRRLVLFPIYGAASIRVPTA